MVAQKKSENFGFFLCDFISEKRIKSIWLSLCNSLPQNIAGNRLAYHKTQLELQSDRYVCQY